MTKLSDERLEELFNECEYVAAETYVSESGGVGPLGVAKLYLEIVPPEELLQVIAELSEYRRRYRVLATAATIAERNKELLERLGGDDELIEAAARAIKESHRPWDATEIPTWDEDSEAWRETYRDFARAAESVIAPAVNAAIAAMTPAERERLVMGPYDNE